MTARRPVGVANYPGDVTEGIRADIDSGRPFGPTYTGELVWPVAAKYDAEADRTRVGFTYLAPDGWQS